MLKPRPLWNVTGWRAVILTAVLAFCVLFVIFSLVNLAMIELG